jgi:hypothetical protein
MKEQADGFSMQNVLFKITEPTTAQGSVEFYTISITLQEFEGQQVSVVQEKHGWWNNETRLPSFDQDFWSPAEAFASFNEAVDRYCTLRTNRAKSGFVHSFSWNRFIGTPTQYKQIEIPTRLKSQPPNEPAA